MTDRSLATCSLAAALGLALLAAAGCGQKPAYDVAPVRGVVTLDGAPLEGGRLMFAPVAQPGELRSGKTGFADIGASGAYTVGTYGPQDGAVVGEHWVTLINVEPDSPAGRKIGFQRVTIPTRQTVVAGDNVIAITLTSADIKKYGQKR